MAYSYVGGASNASNGNTVTYSPTAGNLVVIISSTSSGAGNPTASFKDNNNVSLNIPSNLATTSTPSSTFTTVGWYIAGSGVTTFTATYNGGNPGSIGLRVAEYQGISAANSLIGTPPAFNSQTSPGTGTDAIVSGSQSITIQVPALVLGLCIDTNQLSFNAGTGFTSRAQVNIDGVRVLVQDLRATASGTKTATATTTNGTDAFVSAMLVFSEPLATIYQETNAFSSTAVSSLSVPFPSNVTGNSSIHVIVEALTASTITVQDNQNGVYTQRGSTLSDSSSHFAAQFTMDHVLSGATTVTASFTPNAGNATIWIREIGVTSGFDTHAEASANSSPPTTLSSGNTTPSTAPGVISALCKIFTAGSQTITAGSGFTQDQQLANNWMTEHQRYASTTANAATFGLGGSGSIFTFVLAAFFKESGAPLGSQTASFSRGNLGGNVSYGLTAQTASFTEGIPTPATALSLGALSFAFLEGSIPFGPLLGSQTATFTQGIITVGQGGNIVLALNGQTAQFSQGVPSTLIQYLLDQDTITLVGQTATFAQGALGATLGLPLTAQTLTSTEGVISQNVGPQLLATSAMFTEGAIISNLGNNVTLQLFGQSANFSEGVMQFFPSYALTALSPGFTLGTITFSNAGDFTVSLTGQTATFSAGILVQQFMGGMPNVVGLSYDEAILVLQQAGVFNPAKLNYFSTTPIKLVWIPSPAPPETVLAQSLPPGSAFKVNQNITLTLSEFPLGVAS